MPDAFALKQMVARATRCGWVLPQVATLQRCLLLKNKPKCSLPPQTVSHFQTWLNFSLLLFPQTGIPDQLIFL